VFFLITDQDGKIARQRGRIAGKIIDAPGSEFLQAYQRFRLDARARSYLHVNCAHCHRFGGGGAAKIDLRQEVSLADMKIAGVRASLGSFELTDPYLVSGGDPSASISCSRGWPFT
jgi:hypothetical protein